MSEDVKHIIYAMSDPRLPTGIRYIGQTTQPLHRRLASHISGRNKKTDRCYRQNWINSILAAGLKPLIWPLEICSRENWIKREQHWIRFFKPIGLLTNGSEGGEGSLGNKGWKWSQEALDKISIARKGKCSIAHRRHLSNYWGNPKALKNLEIGRSRKRTPEEIEKTASKTRGLKRTPEQLLRYRAARIGKKQNLSPEQRLRKAELARLYLKWPEGKPRPRRTLESRRKMSEKMKGRKITWKTVRSELNRSITLPILKAWNEKQKRRVVCIETGDVFSSVKEAVKFLGCTRRAFNDCVKNGWRVKGRYWEIEKD